MSQTQSPTIGLELRAPVPETFSEVLAWTLCILSKSWSASSCHRETYSITGPNGSMNSTPASSPISCAETGASARASGRWRPFPPTCGSARGDHGADGPEDDHQRAELRRQRVHGRFRGRQFAHLAESGRGPGESLRRRRRHDRFHQSRRESSTGLKEQTATCMVRPRGWHLPEKHVWLDGKPMPGSLFDFGIFFFHNAAEAARQGERAVLLPAQDGEPSGGPAVERRVPDGPGRVGHSRGAASAPRY